MWQAVKYRIRFHPLVEHDLEATTEWMVDCAGVDVAARRLSEVEEAIESLAGMPHGASRCDEIVPGSRVIPAGRKGVVAFTVDDVMREVLVQAVTYGGAGWVSQSRGRSL